MPVFVAAVKLRRSRRSGAQCTPVSVSYNCGEVEDSQCPIALATAEKEPLSEKNWIKKNLGTFFTDFDTERERSILKYSPPICWRAASSRSQAPMDGEAHSPPLSPGLRQGNPVLIPNGVEKSFKSRRPFSKFQC